MLDSLDTLIAFALIFAVVSLLVTIVVQMITSTLNLRGQNLAWAVAETFEAIDPVLANKAKAYKSGLSKKLADHLLTDRLLSDKQFLWGVGTATAVRPEELFDLLHRIATGQKIVTDEDVKAGIYRLFAALGIDRATLSMSNPTVVLTSLQAAVTSLPGATAAEIKAAADAAAALTNIRTALTAHVAPGAAPALKPAVADVTAWVASLTTAFQGLAASGPREAALEALQLANNHLASLAIHGATVLAEHVQARLTQAYQKFESWLDTGEERAQEWFKMHAWWTTLIVGALFAVGLQLDTVEIYRTVSTNRALRNQLVAQSTVVISQAEKMLDTGNRGLPAAFAKWQNDPSIQSGDVHQALMVAPTLSVANNDTWGSFRQRVTDKLGATLAASDAGKDALQKLDTAVSAQAKSDLTTESANYKAAKADLATTGFDLFPVDAGRWATGLWPWNIPSTHVLGIVFTILLLSLGAPFWFNLLKGLANLRSSVASNIADEDATDAQHGSNPSPGTPPAGVVPPAAKATPAPAGP